MAASQPVRASKTYLADLMSPPDANIRGSVFGGKILQMVDKAAAVCAMRHAHKPVVTVAMEKVEFLVPIKVGDLVIVEAQVTYTGRTSMEIAVDVFAEDLINGERRHANTCLVTMVAVDKNGKPSPVPAVQPETKDEKARFKAGQERHRSRKRP